MADKPILFSGPMVRALLAGTKTQTRRALNPQPRAGGTLVAPPFRGDGNDLHVQFIESDGLPGKSQRLRYAPGDRLYVREHWFTWGIFDDLAPSQLTGKEGVSYIADSHEGPRPGKFRQGIHMPRWASRITLTVTDVRVERLRDISEADAQAEGITRIGAEYIARGSTEWDAGPNFYQVDIGGGSMNDATAVAVYMRLWDWINGEGAAEANPWVAAYTFTVNHGNIDQLRAAA